MLTTTTTAIAGSPANPRTEMIRQLRRVANRRQCHMNICRD